VNPRPKSVVQEICTLRSVGGGGRRLPPPTRWVSSNGHPYRDLRPEAPVDQGDRAKVIDATGRFILPGLIDGHVHLSMFQGAPPGMGFPTSVEFCTLRGAQNLMPIFRARFTSVSVPTKAASGAAVRKKLAIPALRGRLSR
jgi:hypothetical protein